MANRKRSMSISKILKNLEERYGKKPKPPSWTIVETLIFYILYHSSGITAARRAFKFLRDEYVDINEVRVSSLNELRNTLIKAGASEQIALPLRGILKQIFLQENDVSLEPMIELTPEQAKRYLSRFDNLPSHAIDYLLLIKWEHPILPVDKQIARMSSRLGLTSSNSSLTTTQKSIMRDLKKDRYFDFFSLLLEHTSKICGEEPNCDRCVLIKQCKYFLFY